MENQEKQATETVEVKTEQPQINEDKITTNVFEKLVNLFKTEEKTEDKTEEKQTEQPQLTQQDIDKLVEQQVNAKLQEIIPKAKKQKEEALKAEQAKLEQEKQNIELNKQLESVNPQYVDFVKYQVQQNGKTVDEFLKENPQYKQIQKVQQSSLNSGNERGFQIKAADAALLQKFKF